MAFNADTTIAALEPPRFIHGGRVYEGRFLSLAQYQAFAARWRAVEQAGADGDDVAERLVRDLCDTLFPPSRWRFWRPSVASLVLSLPPKAQAEAVADFCACLASSLPSQALTTTGAPTTSTPIPSAVSPTA